MTAPPITVVHADDHPLICAAIADALAHTDDIRLVGQAHNGRDALALVRQLLPAILLVDWRMPEFRPVTDLVALRNEMPQLRILAVSAFDDVEHLKQMIAGGCVGVVNKASAVEDVTEAVRVVAHGGQWFPGITLQRLVAEPGPMLDERDRALLRQLALAASDEDIGCALGYSDRAVRGFLKTLFDKIGVTTRLEATVWAVRSGH
jgi:DNA-binding NarL/FixJ family response regulator